MQKLRKISREGEGTVAETDWLIFKRSTIHGTGGFARRDIPGGTRIIEYVGRRINKAEALAQCELNQVHLFTQRSRGH